MRIIHQLKDEQTAAQGTQVTPRSTGLQRAGSLASNLCSMHLGRPNFPLCQSCGVSLADCFPIPEALWVLEVCSF